MKYLLINVNIYMDCHVYVKLFFQAIYLFLKYTSVEEKIICSLKYCIFVYFNFQTSVMEYKCVI